MLHITIIATLKCDKSVNACHYHDRLADAANTLLLLNRYMFDDTWNILDASTIVVVGLAFIFRMIGLDAAGWDKGPDDGNSAVTSGSPYTAKQTCFFVAQTLLAASAPLLFARALFLSQIDDTLGPMMQVSKYKAYSLMCVDATHA